MIGSKKHIKVLVSPLDWGLGHATRCIPVIKELRNLGCKVVLACSGNTSKLLAKEFPGIEIKELDGYHIQYSANASLFGSMLLQLPGIFQSIQKEHRWLNNLLAQEQFDLVISDNRPGLWNNKTKCIYITHQLLIHSGKGKWPNRLLQRLHSRYMKRFSAVWVPDLEGDKNLAGELSHPSNPLIKPTYIGLISRLEPTASAKEDTDLLVLLSGPEPQRTVLEKKLCAELENYEGKVKLVRGLPQENEPLAGLAANIHSYNHLPAEELQKEMAVAKIIICRSGYTTLMDLIKLNKKAILIPTPGQPEQEYLAEYLQKKNCLPYINQKKFTLAKALHLANEFNYRNDFVQNDFNAYKKILESAANSN